MGVWDRVESLLEGIEQDTAGSAGGAKPPKCIHGLSINSCATCSAQERGAPKGQKSGGSANVDFGETEDLDEILKSTQNERNNEAYPDFNQWQSKIESWLTGLAKKRDDGDEIVRMFRNYELKKGEKYGISDAAEIRKEYWGYGSTWDDYIVDALVHMGKGHLANAMRKGIKDKVLAARYQTGDQKSLSGMPTMTSVFGMSQADLERKKPEFVEFEGKMKDAMADMFPGEQLDEEAWNTAMNFFASSNNEREPNWKYFVDLYNKGGSSGDQLYKQLKRIYSQEKEKNARRASDTEQAAKVSAAGSPQAIIPVKQKMTLKKDQQPAVPDDKYTGKVKYRQWNDPREKRKFPTWWDPFGFKGDIPFSDM